MNEHNYRAIQWIFVISNAYVINFVSSGSFEKDNSEDLKRLGDAMDTLTFINHRKDFLSGLKEYFEKNYDAALSLFEKCIKMEDSVPEYYNYKALCLQKTKGISEINTIEKIFLKALTLDNQNVTALTNLAGCSLFSNKPKKAEEYYLRALDLEPMNPVILKSLARLYQNFNRKDLAKDVLKRVVDLYPSDQAALKLLQNLEEK
jgi:tetratricopeptide (TPR) repeat protein